MLKLCHTAQKSPYLVYWGQGRYLGNKLRCSGRHSTWPTYERFTKRVKTPIQIILHKPYEMTRLFKFKNLDKIITNYFDISTVFSNRMKVLSKRYGNTMWLTFHFYPNASEMYSLLYISIYYKFLNIVRIRFYQKQISNSCSRTSTPHYQISTTMLHDRSKMFWIQLFVQYLPYVCSPWIHQQKLRFSGTEIFHVICASVFQTKFPCKPGLRRTLLIVVVLLFVISCSANISRRIGALNCRGFDLAFWRIQRSSRHSALSQRGVLQSFIIFFYSTARYFNSSCYYSLNFTAFIMSYC